MDDSPHSLFRSAMRFFSGTMLSRISGMVRDIAMAFAFGTQAELAAFLVAFRLAHLLRRLLGEGALQTAFIPHFERLRHGNPHEAGKFFADLMASLSILLILLVLAGMAAAGLLLWKGNLHPGNYDIVFYTLLMLPSLLFICLFGLNASLLQCEKCYFIPSVAPVAFNIIWIIGVLSLMLLPIKQAMAWLSVFIILACLSQWLMTVPKTLAILRGQGFRTCFSSIDWFSQNVRTLAKPMFLGIIGVAAAQINNAMDSLFARYADSEGPAYLWYAIRIQQLPLALFGIAISGALLPPLSRAFKANDLGKYRELLLFSLRRSLAFMFPATAGMLLMGTTGIGLIYGHGGFSSSSMVGTAQCLWAYALGLIPMTFVLILAPAFYARNNYRVPTQASVIAMLANLALNGWLVMSLGLGSASVALATSISAWLNFALLAAGLKKIEGQGTLLSRQFTSGVYKIAVATLLASLAVAFIDYALFGSWDVWEILADASARSITPNYANNLWRFSVQTVVFGLVFLAAARFLKADDLSDLACKIRTIRLRNSE